MSAVTVEDWADALQARGRYPSRQEWGAVFVTVGTPVEARPRPHFADISSFRVLRFYCRGELGGEVFEVGLKDRYAPDNGQETKVPVGPLSRDWKEIEIRLADFVGTDLSEIYVLFEAVFDGDASETIYLRDISYQP